VSVEGYNSKVIGRRNEVNQVKNHQDCFFRHWIHEYLKLFDSVCKRTEERSTHMLTTIAIILIILWLAGVVTATSMGGLIHILLVVAVIMILVRVIQGRRIL